MIFIARVIAAIINILFAAVFLYAGSLLTASIYFMPPLLSIIAFIAIVMLSVLGVLCIFTAIYALVGSL